MSSIAYVTDKHMIEFHRLNGNHSMNFWRPGSQKRFADFIEGDLLFFLAKGSERGRRKEKGIVGYGKFKKSYTLSFKKMWKEYGTLNGYATQDELYDAILKVSKDKVMPKQMNCLFLDEVVFFQSPIYLSEVGVIISNKIESYIYLDKEDPQATSKLLSKANESGIDMWTVAMSSSEPKPTLEEDEVKHQFSLVYQKINDDFYTDTELKKAKKLSREKCEDSSFELIKGSKMDCICYENNEVTIAVPFIYKSKDYNRKIQYLIGHLVSYRILIKEISEYNFKLKFELLTEQPLIDSTVELIKKLNEE
ncbi:hypothetical protein [Anaerorhabdus furcosa]|uniref:Uncharacterized protein n=1 Tax=Anaerorhabdus furcosa TaxID=118967 RepID=A0A1T4MUY1_9FIRM|nr:hypothetical protein [Anaerorhabdus furcosa]SJZ70792.1 hypothetical protein SAMN02745191_1424 [Anaerorhabdus furcosa]